jgi:Zn-dependent metalloprotease
VKRHALMALFMPLISIAAPFSFAADKSHVAVPAMMGNAKMGLLCAQAPGLPSQDCQTAAIPDTPLTRVRFPYIPEQYNLFYRDENSRVFSQYSGYPFVVKHENGVCSLENAAVITRQNTVEYPVYSYACNGEAIESANLAGVLFDYIGRGAFQAENDAHFYAGITMDILHQQFAQMYPDSADACSASADYCLEQLSVIVGGDRTYLTSSWDGKHVLLDDGLATAGQFSHSTSLDIIAHETGHALLTWNSEIVHSAGDSSVIGEAFSDLTALFVRSEFYKRLQASGVQNFIESDAYQQLSADGRFFYALAWDKFVHNRALRYFYSPRTDGASIDDWRDIETKTPGPHYQAGIFNRFFYRLSISDGWDIAKTFRLAMKAAQTCFVENT